MVSLRKSSIFGIKLKYYQYFSPMSKNIHQFAMIAVILPFIGLSYCKTIDKSAKKIYVIFLSIADAFIATKTGSTKVIMGLFVGFVIWIVIYIYENSFFTKKDRKMIIVAFLAFVSVFIMLNITTIIQLLKTFFSENDGHGEREYLYGQALQMIAKSPLVGFGPSIHVTRSSGTSLIDAHETFLSAALSGGIIGAFFIALCLFIGAMNVLKSRSPLLFTAMVPIFIYALGGDILRKLGLWIIFLLLAYSDSFVERIYEKDGKMNAI